MEKKLQESASILDKSRARARKVKQEFERIKKKRSVGRRAHYYHLYGDCRYEKFNGAFEHISGNIDEIYKVCDHTVCSSGRRIY